MGTLSESEDLTNLFDEIIFENAVIHQPLDEVSTETNLEEVSIEDIENWGQQIKVPSIRNRLVRNTTLLFDTASVQPVSRDPVSIDYDSGSISSVRFAIINTDLQIDHQELYNGGVPDFYWHGKPPRGLLTPREKVRPEIIEARATQLAAAIAAGADIVSFCEFALPPAIIDKTAICDAGGSIDLFDEETLAYIDRQHEGAAKEVLARAHEINGTGPDDTPFIFYGSSHCNVTRFNIGVVSPGQPIESEYKLRVERSNPLAAPADPPGTPEELRIERPAKREELRSGPLVHKKRFPARRAGELARVPDDHEFRTYFHPLGRICVLICSDSIDINQFTNIIRYNRDAGPNAINRIFMVIVPTYNQSIFLLNICRDLSAMARTNVLVTNAVGEIIVDFNTGNTDSLPASNLFFDGRPLNALINRKMVSKAECQDSTVDVYDLNIQFQRDVLKRELEIEPESKSKR